MNKYNVRKYGDDYKLVLDGEPVDIAEHYAQASRKTAIYPLPYISYKNRKYPNGKTCDFEFSGLFYPILGLIGEVVELNRALISLEDTAEVEHEMGGCLWYIARIYEQLNQAMIIKDHEKGDAFLAIAIIIEGSGDIAQLYKKAYRDDEGVLTLSRKKQIHVILDRILMNLSRISSLRSAAMQNLIQLDSRQERGKLKGDGDHR